jgi:cellulose synthase/poly-beta-1,6-N-acetylglucosamine synthase-like glycosyltransferase
MNFLPEELPVRILLYIAGLAAFIQSLYYLLLYARLAFHKPRAQVQTNEPFTIVIAAKNEARNLSHFLKDILEQKHTKYQVVVVNDCSWDSTQKILEEFADAYPHLKITTLIEQEKYRHGKKFALAIGIKGAEFDKLVFTDADCRPASARWAAMMAGSLSGQKEIVIGYGAYRKEKGLLNAWIRFDTAYNAMQYLSYALAGIPYMGTGRNLAYTRPLFFKNKGFARHQHILSGDDDLFVNAVACKANTTVQLHPDAFTYSVPEKTFTGWLKQKRRHMSASSYYRLVHRLLLGCFYASQILFYASLVALLLLKTDYRLVAAIFLFRLIIQMPVMALGFSKLKEKGLLIFTLFFDFFVTLLYPILAIINLFNKKHTWK